MKTQPPNTQWTPDQWRAIATDDRSLLVSAAAGSGKTSVLAERCAFLVCDADDPCDIDQLLAITFTKAAAAEMRSRIGERLRNRLEADDSDRLRRQLLLIDRASITTLDAFCGSIVRRHFQLADLDPSFIQLDEEEAGLLRRETARALLEKRYDADADGSFQHLVDQLAEGNDDRIVGQLLHISSLRASLIDPAAWIERAKTRLQSAAENFAESDVAAELRDYTERMIVESILQAERAEEQLRAMPGVAAAYVPYMAAMNAELIEWQIALAESFDAFAARFNAFEFARLPSAKADAEERKAGQALIESVRKEMKTGRLAELAGFSAAEWQAGIASTSAAATTLLDLVQEFDRDYAKAKSDLRALDFADLARFAFHILRDEQSTVLAPSPVAIEYQRQYRHVLVDEYQDINALQDAIISLLSRENAGGAGKTKSNLFCVGDVKQSIYRFRLAEPKNFLDRQRRLKSGDRRRGETIDLQANFRSRGPLLETINRVFHRLMTPVVEIDYDDSHKLVPAFDYHDSPGGFTGKPIELHLIDADESSDEGQSGASEESDDDLDNIELEGLLIARRIRELMGLGDSPRREVYDSKKKLFRPMEFHDIAILVRTAKFKSDQLAEILRDHDVSVYTDSRGGFFDALEIRDLLALLRVLDNARQDVPLAAVLRSPIFQLPDAADALAKVRVAFPPRDWPFHIAVAKYARDTDPLGKSLVAILGQLNTWREAAHRRPLAEVIWRIFEESGYLAYVSAMPGGAQRVANLIELHSRARQFGTFQRQGLSRFLAFLESLREEQEVGRASVAAGAEDAVQIMSIHQSKGLEFPVVIIPDLGKGFNFQDANGRVLIDRDRFVGIRAIDGPRHVHYPTAPWLLVREELRRKMIAEEVRVLYVALTRAREHLILIGSGKTKFVDEWLNGPLPEGDRLPDDAILSASKPLDWLAPVTRAIEFEEPGRFEIARHARADVFALRNDAQTGATRTAEFDLVTRLRPLHAKAATTPAATGVVNSITRRYAFEELTVTPAAWSVTSVTKQGKLAPGAESRSRAGVVPFEAALPLPRFVAGDDGLTAAAAGSLTHLVMQYVDLAEASSVAAVQKQLAKLIERRLVPDFAAALVEVDSIVWFAATPLGKAIAKAGSKVRRELPVVRTRDLDWQAGPNDETDSILLRGRLDALVPEAGGWRIVDYKTDAVNADTVEARGVFYRPQVTAYAEAIAQVTGERVVGASLVFLKARRVIELAE